MFKKVIIITFNFILVACASEDTGSSLFDEGSSNSFSTAERVFKGDIERAAINSPTDRDYYYTVLPAIAFPYLMQFGAAPDVPSNAVLECFLYDESLALLVTDFSDADGKCNVSTQTTQGVTETYYLRVNSADGIEGNYSVATSYIILN